MTGQDGAAGVIADLVRTHSGAGLPVRLRLWDGSEVGPAGETVRLIENAGFEVTGVEGLREHYVRTIRAWLDNFEASLPEIAKLRTAEQVRVWRLYLAGSALAFEEGRMGVDQILAVRKPG